MVVGRPASAGRMGDLPLLVVWGVLVALCLLSALFIFSIMKRLERVAK